MRLLAIVLIVIALAAPCTPPQIAAFGDSITVGYGAHSRAQMWTERLATVTGPIENLAVGGSTVAQQLSSQITPYAGPATTAIWMSCTNDLLRNTPPSNYRATLRAGVLALEARGMVVYLGTCLAIKDRPDLVSLHAAYSDAARSVAAETGAILVDVDSAYDAQAMESPPPLTYHPNDAGHRAIAAAFLAAWRWQQYLPLIGGAAYPAP